jgi:DNA-directed RNA polymerase specialized sigma subunit
MSQNLKSMKSTVSKPELVLANLGLVEMALMGDKVQSMPQSIESKHLLHIGYEALCKAAENYSGKPGAAFEIYAYMCIEDTLTAALERSNMASA